MHVLITGGAGFIGTALARRLLASRETAVMRLVIADPAPLARALAADPRVVHAAIDASDPAALAMLFDEAARLPRADGGRGSSHGSLEAAGGFDRIFALGASLTHEAERDPEQGWRVNVLAMVALLARCERLPRPPRLVYTSSIAAFGGSLPAVVDDGVPRTPRTTYGTHKAIVELLIDDATRRGVVDGRTLRLPIVLTRPGPPAPSVSDRIAALVREPLRGQPARCPLTRSTRVPLASVQSVAQALTTLADVPALAPDTTRAMNLPSLSVTIGELVDAVAGIATWRDWRSPVGPIAIAPDPALQHVVDAWPREFDSAAARALGLGADASLPALIERFLAQERQAGDDDDGDHDEEGEARPSPRPATRG